MPIVSRLSRTLLYLLFALPLVFIPGLESSFVQPKRWVLYGVAGVLSLLVLRRKETASWEPWAIAFALGVSVLDWSMQGRLWIHTAELTFGLCALLVLIKGPPVIDWEGEGARASRALLVVGLILSAVIFAQALGLDPLHYGDSEKLFKWRLYGTLGNPNRAGAVLAAILVYVSLGPHTGKLRSWMLGTIGLACVLTQSRGAWLASVVAYAMATGFSWRRAGTPIWTGLLAVLICAVTLRSKFLDGVLNFESIEGRVYHWRSAFSLFLEHPQLGIGWGEYTLRLDQEAEYVHNEYLGLLVELGWVGSLPLFFAIGAVIRRAWLQRIQDPAVLGLLVYLAVLSIYDFPLREPSLLALALLGVFATLPQGSRRRDPHDLN